MYISKVGVALACDAVAGVKVDQDSLVQQAEEILTERYGFFFTTLQFEARDRDEGSTRSVDIFA